MTEYVILRRIDNYHSSAWEWTGSRSAWSPAAAIRHFAEETGAEHSAVFLAIPARAWKPMLVSVTNEVRVTVEVAP